MKSLDLIKRLVLLDETLDNEIEIESLELFSITSIDARISTSGNKSIILQIEPKDIDSLWK